MHNAGEPAHREHRDAQAGGQGDPDGGPQGDPIDRIEATESRELSLLSRERLSCWPSTDDGSYGTCAECDDPIAPGRLRAIPEATLCVRCQERIEPAQASQRTVRGFYAEPSASVDEPDDD